MLSRSLQMGLFAFAATCSSSDRPPPATGPAPPATEACNPDHAEILGDWARPEVQLLDAQGNVSAAAGWRAELWLPHAPYRMGGCLYSNASSFLSAAPIADRPAILVTLSHPTAGAAQLVANAATLSISGGRALDQIPMPTEDPRIVTRGLNEHFVEYAFAFPPTPLTWTKLEIEIPIDGSEARLHVRFVRER